MIRIVCISLFLGSWISGFGQGLFNNGATITMSDNIIVTVNDVNGHFKDSLGGIIEITDTATIRVEGNWINNGATTIFSTNNGLVDLNGGNQRITGTDMTGFPSLSLTGTANKTLDVNALVGGGNSGNRKGVLSLGARSLLLNSNRLIVNNDQTWAITTSGGGIVSETDASSGYGEVQWNIRDQTGDYTIPFQSIAFAAIPYTLEANSPGSQASDSGNVLISTYPTNTTANPNNRNLPTGVSNTLNEYGRENAEKMVDRYWVVLSDGYNSAPSAQNRFTYLDAEWNTSGGSTNDIIEANLKPVRLNSSTGDWDYPGIGTINTAVNNATSGQSDFRGVWTLTDSTVCSIARFSWTGNCVDDLIEFLDASSINPGTIETYDWSFGNGSQSNDQNPSTVYTSAGSYNVRLIVIANSGCPDTSIQGVNIDARAVADFTVDDDPLVDYPVAFDEISQNASDWSWDFGDGSSDVGPNVQKTYIAQGVYDVVLIANNIANCPDTISKQVEVNLPSLFLIPSAFSPNSNDDLNNQFGLVTLQNVTEFNMTVFNRWGEQIFTTDDRNEKWDGTYNGKPCLAGSYMYMIRFRDRKMSFHFESGSVLLRR